jgi:arsenate reductase (glutaredoxin)
MTLRHVAGGAVLSSRLPRFEHAGSRTGRAGPAISAIMKRTLYGIPNCDTVKKARTWLADHGHDFSFHDFKKQGLDRATVANWLEQIDWEVLVNRKGMTWRNLADEQKALVTDKDSALALMLSNPSVIKRPVLDNGGTFSVGFSADKYRGIFEGAAA